MLLTLFHCSGSLPPPPICLGLFFSASLGVLSLSYLRISVLASISLSLSLSLPLILLFSKSLDSWITADLLQRRGPLTRPPLCPLPGSPASLGPLSFPLSRPRAGNLGQTSSPYLSSPPPLPALKIAGEIGTDAEGVRAGARPRRENRVSGHSRPSGGPSQRLDTRRSQTRGIVDEPQNCRLKAKIIETQSGERPQWTENQKEGRPRQKETQERGISIGFNTEKNQRP